MKLTYDDKVSLTTSPLPRANKCTADDLNEIKEVVNSNDDVLELTQHDLVELALNFEESLEYTETEAVIGKWIDGKPLYQKVINFGTLPNNANKAVSHGINDLKQIVEFSAFAGSSQNAGGIPIPHAVPNYQVYAFIDNSYVNITTTSDRTAYTRTVVILKYTKSTD